MSDTHSSTHAHEDQLLHLVIGGELISPQKVAFRDLSKVHFVGAFANYASAYKAWKASAQQTVDNAHMRYFIIHAHRLLDPDGDGEFGIAAKNVK